MSSAVVAKLPGGYTSAVARPKAPSIMGVAHQGTHLRQLLRVRCSLRFAHHPTPHARAAEERAEIGRRAMLLHGGEPLVEGAGAAKIRSRSVARAFAHDLGGDSLAGLGHDTAVAGEKLEARMALDVDETRGHDPAAGIDGLDGADRGERAGRTDARQAFVAYPHVGVGPGIAGAVDEAAVDDQQVEGSTRALLGRCYRREGNKNPRRDRGRSGQGAESCLQRRSPTASASRRKS